MSSKVASQFPSRENNVIEDGFDATLSQDVETVPDAFDGAPMTGGVDITFFEGDGDFHARFVYVDPIVREEMLLVDDEANGEKITIAKPGGRATNSWTCRWI